MIPQRIQVYDLPLRKTNETKYPMFATYSNGDNVSQIKIFRCINKVVASMVTYL